MFMYSAGFHFQLLLFFFSSSRFSDKMTTVEDGRTEKITTDPYQQNSLHIEVRESDEKMDTNTPVHNNNIMALKTGVVPLNGKVEKGLLLQFSYPC